MATQIDPVPIVLMTTGGTIDKSYFDDLNRYHFGESVILRLLQIARVSHPFRIVELMRKDSLDLTDEDRLLLRTLVAQESAMKIVVTHGTDTMTKTACAISDAAPDKTIIFTGALTPARFSDSDAAFNLGMAFATAQVAPPGIYITMNGVVFHANAVEKDRTKGFIPKNP